MPESRRTNATLLAENHRLRAQVAQLEDRLDHFLEHGETAKALKANESLHRDVMSLVADVVLLTDDAGRLMYVSPNAHFVFGHSAREIFRQGRINRVLPSDLFDPDVLEQRGDIANIECQIRDALGRARPLLVTVRRINAHGGTTMFVVRDVSEHLQMKLERELLEQSLERRVSQRTKELYESRERFRRMMEGLRDEYLFYATDVHGTITYISPSIYTILGYTPQETIGLNWRQRVDRAHELYPELERLEAMRFAGQETPAFRAPVLHATGRLLIMEFRDAPVYDVEGRVIATEGIGKDITERLEKDEALRRAKDELELRVQERTAELQATNQELVDSRQRYQSVVDDQLEFIVRWRDGGQVIFENESYRRYCAASQKEKLGESFLSSIVEEDREALERVLAGLSVNNRVVTHDHRVEAPDGRIYWERWTHRALFNAQGELVEYQSVGSDQTDKRRRGKQAEDFSVALAQLGTLNSREQDVMELVVAGDANKVIARKLNLSVKTIEKHRGSLMKKLQVRSVQELVRVAMLIDESMHP